MDRRPASPEARQYPGRSTNRALHITQQSPATLLIRDGAVLTPDGWIEPGYVCLGDTTIRTIAAGEPPADLVTAAEVVIEARHMAVLPGLTNAHTHLSQTLMRGLARGRPLLPWLKEIIWPLQVAMSPAELHLAAMLGLVENLRAGVTEVVDHHKVTATAAHTEAVCRAASEVGLRLTLARAWADRGARAEPAERILADLERLFTLAPPGVRIANGPLVPWRCSAPTLERCCGLARRHGAPTHIHVSETRDEVQTTLDETGLRPVAWLDSLGLLGPDTQVVHAIWLDEAEMDLLAARTAVVVHCPVSNAILGSGIAPVAGLLRRGIDVRLGTDGPASSDSQDLPETAKAALSLARIAALDPTALSPQAALAMALGGRSLVAGAPADVAVINLNTPHACTVHDATSALVLSSHSSDVDTVVAGGRLLLHRKRLTMLDEAALLDECRIAAESLTRRAGI